ncbi:MAG: hypothetical protein EOP86_17470, partial [Verrucomicrobiaceae bacterium]
MEGKDTSLWPELYQNFPEFSSPRGVSRTLMNIPPTLLNHSLPVSRRLSAVSRRFGLLLLLAMAFSLLSIRALALDVQWHDAKSLEVEGRGWEKTATLYGRLPDSAEGRVPKTAWDLSRD